MFDEVDWLRPWLAPFVRLARACGTTRDWPVHMSALARRQSMVNHAGRAITFVDQAQLPVGTAYESYISDTGCIPTRNNLHDFFNALVWLRYPAAKVQLNATQANEITSRAAAAAGQGLRPGSTPRGAVRDRATIFDENAGILLTCDTSIEAAVRTHRWQEALLDCRDAFGKRCEVRLFGHALLEKLVRPYKAITAHVWILAVPPAYFDTDPSERSQAVDHLLSASLRQGLLNMPATPLPVLGVPGWHPHQDAAFYADAAVFRPRRPSPAGG